MPQSPAATPLGITVQSRGRAELLDLCEFDGPRTRTVLVQFTAAATPEPPGAPA